MSNFYAAMLVISVFSITLQTFILLKIPSSRKQENKKTRKQENLVN